MKLQTPILITGASGFVGANLLHRLIQEKIPQKKTHIILRKNSSIWRIKDLLKQVSVHVIDLKDASKTSRLLKKIKPKTIFHLATHGAYPYQMDEKEIFESNITSTFNLLQASLNVGFDSFINTGSSSEYGINQMPMKEEDILKPVTAYGATKAWASLYSNYLFIEKKAPITTLRLFGVYGYYEPKGRLIPNIILHLLNKQRPLLNEPHFTRDFVFIDDVVNAYFQAAEKKLSGMILNIGSSKKTTLEEIFYLITKIMKVKIEPAWANYKNSSFDTNRRIADIRYAKKHLGWQPETTLKTGLEKTIEWFRKNYPLYS